MLIPDDPEIDALVEIIDRVADRTMIGLDEAMSRGNSMGLRIAITEALIVLGINGAVLDQLMTGVDT